MAWSRPEDGLEQATEEAALVVGLPSTSTRIPRKKWAGSIEEDIKKKNQVTISNWHKKANEENKLEWKNRIKKVGRTENLASS